MKITDLDYNESLSISNGKEQITWIKKADDKSVFIFRRMHFKGGKLFRVMVNRKLGYQEDDELAFRLDTGWKRV
jgi:hypothetical protein